MQSRQIMLENYLQELIAKPDVCRCEELDRFLTSATDRKYAAPVKARFSFVCVCVLVAVCRWSDESSMCRYEQLDRFLTSVTDRKYATPAKAHFSFVCLLLRADRWSDEKATKHNIHPSLLPLVFCHTRR